MSSWFSGIADTISSSVSAVQKDLLEFVDTVRDDTATTVAESVHTIREAKDSEEGLQAGVARAMQGVVHNISSSVASDTPARRRQQAANRHQTYDRSEAKVHALQRDRETYLSEPDDIDAYAAWKENFDLHAKTEDISKLLSNDEDIRKLHTELIPEVISYNLFWHRYFFRLYSIEVSEQRRQELVKSIAEDTGDDEAFGDWDDDVEEEEEETTKKADGGEDEARGGEVKVPIAAAPAAVASEEVREVAVRCESPALDEDDEAIRVLVAEARATAEASTPVSTPTTPAAFAAVADGEPPAPALTAPALTASAPSPTPTQTAAATMEASPESQPDSTTSTPTANTPTSSSTLPTAASQLAATDAYVETDDDDDFSTDKVVADTEVERLTAQQPVPNTCQDTPRETTASSSSTESFEMVEAEDGDAPVVVPQIANKIKVPAPTDAAAVDAAAALATETPTALVSGNGNDNDDEDDGWGEWE